MNNVISDLQHLALLEGDLLVARANVRQGIGTERLSPTELTDAEEDIFSAIYRLHYGLSSGRYADIRPAANGGTRPKPACRLASWIRLTLAYGPVSQQP